MPKTWTSIEPTAELQWWLDNPEGNRPRRWVLMQRVWFHSWQQGEDDDIATLLETTSDWRPVPVALSPNDAVEFKKVNGELTPADVYFEGELR